VIGIDWGIERTVARTIISERTSLQGNLSPLVLYTEKETIRESVKNMLQEFGTQRLIANLGHGLNPDHDVEKVGVFIDAVHEFSLAINKT